MEERTLPRYPAGKREMIFGLLVLLFGTFTWNSILYGGFCLGFALGAVALTGCSFWYLLRCGFLLGVSLFPAVRKANAAAAYLRGSHRNELYQLREGFTVVRGDYAVRVAGELRQYVEVGVLADGYCRLYSVGIPAVLCDGVKPLDVIVGGVAVGHEYHHRRERQARRLHELVP